MSLKQRRARRAEIKDRITKLRKKIADKRDRQDDANTDDRADHLADEIEALVAELDRLVPRYKKLGRKLKRLAKKAQRRKHYASKNFTYAEFNCREGGPVPEYMHPHLRDLCGKFLERMRARFGGCYVTSGHRWSWYDAMIGGVGGYHVYEKYRSQPAADCIFERGTPAEWAAYARQIADELGLGGVGQYDNSGFVHIDTGPRRNWWG